MLFYLEIACVQTSGSAVWHFEWRGDTLEIGNRSSVICTIFWSGASLKPLKSCWPENIGLRRRTFLDHERCGISRAKTLGAQNVPVNQKWLVVRLELMEIRLFYSHYVQVMRVTGCSTDLFRPQYPLDALCFSACRRRHSLSSSPLLSPRQGGGRRGLVAVMDGWSQKWDPEVDGQGPWRRHLTKWAPFSLGRVH